MEFEGTINKSNILYVPKEIKELLGNNIKLKVIGNFVLITPKNTDTSTMLKYVKLLKEEIEIRLEVEKQAQTASQS